MHQWWGDNVTEGDYNLTFYKEGLATLAEFLYQARLAENANGGPYSSKGQAAFQASLVKTFNQSYAAGGGVLDGRAVEPGTGWPVLRFFDVRAARHRLHRAAADPRPRATSPRRWSSSSAPTAAATSPSPNSKPFPAVAARSDQRLPARGCSEFFTQWWDTAYPAGGRKHRPQLTGPGLAGPASTTPTAAAASRRALVKPVIPGHRTFHREATGRTMRGCAGAGRAGDCAPRTRVPRAGR